MPQTQYRSTHLLQHDAPNEVSFVKFAFKVMQYNVCTLLLNDKFAVLDTLQLRLVKKQCREKNIVIAGLQETRLQECAIQQDGFLFITSGAQEGNYGTAVLVDLQAVCTAGKLDPPSFFAKDFRVVINHPRLLAIDCYAKYLQFRMISGHAPSADAEQSDKDTWYRLYERACNTSLHIVALTDMNSKFELRHNPQLQVSTGAKNSFQRFNDHMEQIHLAVPND